MTVADLAELPVAEKLKLMETLWDSLCAQSAGAVASPDWHGEVLDERLRRLAGGEETVSDWREAKERIRTQARTR
jgi:hypothetical protein